MFEMKPGRFSDRFLAYVIDTVPFTAGAVFTVWAWGGPLHRPLNVHFLQAAGVGWAALAVLWQFLGNSTGATPGKALLGLSVVGENGERVGAMRAAFRAVFWLVSTPLGNFGFLLALFHPRTRALHDLLAGTYVVEAGPRRSSGAPAFFAAGLIAVAAAGAHYALAAWSPSREDVAAVARAREGLEVLAQLEANFKNAHGVYAATLDDLSSASGDAATFEAAMREAFAPAPFTIEAGNRGWRVTAAAKDRRRTTVRRSGP